MKMIYMDNAGRDRGAGVCVVASVLIDVDEQWVPVAREMERLKAEFFPEEAKAGFTIHTSDIFGGAKSFGSSRYSLDHRLAVLTAVSTMITEFEIPVSIGYSRSRATEVSEKGLPMRSTGAVDGDHSFALMQALAASDRVMRESFPGEYAMVIAEDVHGRREQLLNAFLVMRLRDFVDTLPAEYRDLFPLRRIVGSLHFVAKGGDHLLQAADVCAFVARRYAEGFRGGSDLLAVLLKERPPEEIQTASAVAFVARRKLA
ncbi:hypothetical protein ACFQX4_26650 [Roseomonas sp. GCM10028921]